MKSERLGGLYIEALTKFLREGATCLYLETSKLEIFPDEAEKLFDALRRSYLKKIVFEDSPIEININKGSYVHYFISSGIIEALRGNLLPGPDFIKIIGFGRDPESKKELKTSLIYLIKEKNIGFLDLSVSGFCAPDITEIEENLNEKAIQGDCPNLNEI